MYYKKLISIIFVCAININYFLIIAQPNTIAGLSLWLKADSGVIYDGSFKVSFWNDVSGNGKNFIQTNNSLQPMFITSIDSINNKSSVRFNGNTLFTNQNVEIGSVFILANYEYDYFLDYAGLFTRIAVEDGNTDYLLVSASGNTTFYSSILGSNLYINDIQTNNFAPLKRPKIIYGFLNTPVSWNDVALGLDRSLGGRYWKGDIFEIIVFDRKLQENEVSQVKTYLMNKYAPPINLPNDTLLQSFCPFTIKTQGYYTSYLWSNGSTDDSLVVTTSGYYKITTTDIFGRQTFDSIFVQFPSPDFFPTYTICLGDSAYVNSQLGNNVSYLWSNGNTQSYNYIKNEGLYFVTLTDAYSCSMIDSFFVDVDSLSILPLFTTDTLHLCEGNILNMNQNLTDIVHYYWQPTGDTLSYTTVLSSDYYFLSVVNSHGCSQRDSIFVHVFGKTPIVNFSSSHTCKGDSTHFTDLSAPTDTSTITFWQWVINGDTLLEKNPSYLFSQYGLFTVNLTVGTNVGCFQSNEQVIEVFPLPVCNFNVIRLCSRYNSYFSSLSSIATGTISKLTWNWGDGTISYDDDTIHTYYLPGNYFVTLTVESNEGCIDSISKIIEIKPSPFAGFDVSPSCSNNPTFFADTSITDFFNPIMQWNWLFGDGATSNTQHPNHVYNTTGIYNVTLIIKTLNGCIDSAQQIITVSTKPHADFIADSACLGQPVYIQDQSSVTNGQIIEWNWYVHSNYFSSQQNPIYVASELGSIPLTLIVKSNTQCTDTISKSILVYPLPNVQFDLNPYYGALPLTVEFVNFSEFGDSFWNFGDNSFSNQTNPVHVFQDSGLYHVWLTQTSIHGCKDSISKTVLVVPNLLDLAVEKVNFTKQSDFIYIHTLLSNVGTLPIENPLLTLMVDGKTYVSEMVFDTIFLGEKRNYTFNGILPIKEGLPRYLCVSGTVLNNQVEVDLSNNENCLSFNDDEQILNLFPNPASDQLFMLLQLSDEQNVVFSIIEITGKIIYQYQVFLKNEIHKLTFDIQSLSQGVYAIQVKTKKHTFVRKFIKN